YSFPTRRSSDLRWERLFFEGAEEALESTRQKNGSSPDLLRQLYAKIGAQSVELEVLKKQLSHPQPGVGSQESGVRSQESGIRSQESRIRKQESKAKSQQTELHFF